MLGRVLLTYAQIVGLFLSPSMYHCINPKQFRNKLESLETTPVRNYELQTLSSQQCIV